MPGARIDDEGMTAAQVVAVLDCLELAGCPVWVDGGWGVDALAGRQTRRHRDLDLALSREYEEAAIVALAALGYLVETDWRPTRVELAAAGSGWVDLHPLDFDDRGDGVQLGLEAERYVYPAAGFVTGSIAGRSVGCLSAAQQIAWHAGYELRAVDHHDLMVLRQLA